LVIYLVS